MKEWRRERRMKRIQDCTLLAYTPAALSGLCFGGGVSQGLEPLGPWLDLLGRGRLPAGPVGSSLRLPEASALLFSAGVAVVPAVVLLGFLCFGGPLDVCGSDLLSVRPGTMGQVCGSSHSLLHIFVEKPCIQKHVHTHTHRC
ncbi:hypothetical protein AMECASPLE_039424 [Ameca splendens]|uniref:Uncharacterized protein n=1 Tax=Ameca splendens TaxID=208324 RepID=A0ABV0YW16_9TELE